MHRNHPTDLLATFMASQHGPLLTEKKERRYLVLVDKYLPKVKKQKIGRKKTREDVREIRLEKQDEPVRVRHARRARDILIRANLGWVVKIAKRFVGNHPLTLLDLIDEGVDGLMRAIDGFDVSRKTRLTTFATWWIRERIQSAIKEQVGSIRLPPYMAEEIRKYHLAVADLLQQCPDRPPTNREIAAKLGPKVRVKTVETIQVAIRAVVALEAMSKGEGNLFEIADAGPEPDAICQDEEMVRMREQGVAKAMEALNKNEVQVIRLRFGFTEDGQKLTLKEVGALLGVTRERARQIESEALAKLRNQKNDLRGLL